MLRVTPIYGSQWSPEGQAEEPTCTLVEYGDCRVLINVGWIQNQNHHHQHHYQYHNDPDGGHSGSGDLVDFPQLPDHDCLLLTDSTLQSMGGLPLYYHQQRQKRQAAKRPRGRRHMTAPDTVTSDGKRPLNDAMEVEYPEGGTNEEEDEEVPTEQQQQQLPPIYATFPIVKMGQMTLYDQHANLCLDGGCPPFTLSQIDDAIAAIQCIKYSQQILVRPKTNRKTASSSSLLSAPQHNKQEQATLSIIAHRAGHCVGGSFFVLQRIQDETTVVLTKTYNIAKELHLDSSTLLKHATTPDVLVTYPGGPALASFKALAVQQPTASNAGNKTSKTNKGASILAAPQLVAQVERQLTESVMAVLRRNGNVLLPVDAASRCLELVLLLNRHWERHRLKAAYNLVWLGPMVQNTMEFAKSQLEWMSNSLLQSLASDSKDANNPLQQGQQQQRSNSGPNMIGESSLFLFKTIQFCATVGEVEQLMQQNPTCILATGFGLEHGPARNLLLLLADNPDNAIFFTDSSQAYLRRRQQRQPQRPHQQTSTGGAIRPGSDSAGIESNEENQQQERNQTDHRDQEQEKDAMVPKTGIETPSAVAVEEKSNNQDSNPVIDTAKNKNNTEVGGGGGGSGAAAVVVDEEGVKEAAEAAAAEDDGGDEDEDGNRSSLLLGSSTTAGMMSSSKLVVLRNPQQDASPWNTAAQLLRAWAMAKAKDEEMEDSIWVDLPVPKRVPLAGAELKAFLAAEEEARLHRMKLQQQQAMLREVELAKGQLRLGEEEGAASGGDHAAASGGAAKVISSSGGTKTTTSIVRPRKKSRFDQSLFLKFSKPLHLCFEVREEAVGIGQNDSIAKFGIGESIGRSGEVLEDDYGIAVQHDHFTDIVSGVDPSKFGATGRVGEDVLRRGFGYAGSSGGGGGPKAVSDDEGPSGGGGVTGEGSDGGVDNDQELQEAVDLSEGNGIIRGRNGRPPMKVSTVICKLEVLAEISYIPGLEGRVDARAARQSVRALQPRQVIVLGGPDSNNTIETMKQEEQELPLVDSVAQLAEAAQSFFAAAPAPIASSSLLFTPTNGETVELKVGHAAYAVRLIDTPFQTPEEKEVGLPVPEPAEPFEIKLGPCTVSWIDAVATGQKVALDGSLVLAPPAHKKKKSPSLYLSSGDVLLTDLRAELMAHPQGRFKADYSAHKGYAQLVINNGKVIVRKDLNSGRIQVEGPLSQDFWTVRDIVCRQYVVL
ncbi:hypothetical protein ACA910_009030 [Epithemia clementina (nom. ined.)]